MDETIKPPKSPLLTSALKYWDFGGQGSTQRVLQGLNILSIYSSFRHRHLPQVHLGFAISNKLEVWTLSWQLLPPCKCCLGHRMVIQKLQGVASMANHSFWDSTLLPLKSMYSQVIGSFLPPDRPQVRRKRGRSRCGVTGQEFLGWPGVHGWLHISNVWRWGIPYIPHS